MQKTVVSYRFSWWRFKQAKRFFPQLSKNFKSHKQLINFLERADSKTTLLVWGVTLKEENISIENPYVEVIRLEDGFIRSAGLGIKFTPPLSLVGDDLGIYYDATEPSRLEFLLENTEFNRELISRAKLLITLINKLNITKYNLVETDVKIPSFDKKIIVVPGQVETDKSIKYGSPFIKTNLALLKKVRDLNPDAFVIYKPHPDVAAGLRKGSYKPETLSRFADLICENCSTLSLIKVADEIHTMTSLFGFEALLRGKKVVCYGQPFYSGWGLTTDIYPLTRRTRKLKLEELVAGTIILYPMYRSLITNEKLTPEEAICEVLYLKKKPPLKLKLWSLLWNFLTPILKLRRF